MNELEIIHHGRIPGLTAFFNTVDYRTPHFHPEWELMWLLDNPLTVSSGAGTIQAAQYGVEVTIAEADGVYTLTLKK